MSEHSTRAVLRYLIPGDEKPIYYASAGGADAQLNISNAEEVFEDCWKSLTFLLITGPLLNSCVNLRNKL